MNRDDVEYNDLFILFTDDEENVEYAINVSASLYAAGPDTVKDDVVPAVANLWYDIWLDAENIDAPTLTPNPIELSDAVAAVTDRTAVRDALGRIVSWTVTVEVKANDGSVIDSKNDIAAVLADNTNGVVADKTLSADKKTLTITVTGLTKDNTLVLTGKGAVDAAALADALVEDYRSYLAAVADGTGVDAAREAFFAAAVAYEDYAGNDPTDNADVAYAAAKAAADKIAADIDDAVLTSFAGIKSAMDLPQLSDNAEKLVTWSTGDVPAADAYDDKLEKIAEAAELYNQAYEVVKTYNAWQAATLPSEEAAARAAYLAAFEAITAEELDLINHFTDSNMYTFGSTTNWEDSYNAR